MAISRADATNINFPKRRAQRELSEAGVDALLAPLAGRSLLIAVSGGPDSTALLVMAAEWAARNQMARLAAATVDHGLRPESAAEAKSVASLAARLGVPHATLRWAGAKPATGMMERAREARYRLLIDHALALDAEAIVTAHHADDQAETVLFRLLRGSGLKGLGGIEAISRREGLVIARPLIGLEKSALVGFCRARAVPFVEDPTNASPAFARTRLKPLLAALAEEGLDARGFVRVARRLQQADEALERMTAAVAARLGTEGPLEARTLFDEPSAIVERILIQRIAAAGGRDESRIGLEKVESLAVSLRAALACGRPMAANVGGALVRLTAKGS
ncbi:MAG: tRNA lysidine(34) synthetase TilS, partial [Hyphomicrobiales bacterium]|nr:tRNA lysidine(34) synthetase TilS [Hyphomicrobiales bacterium]